MLLDEATAALDADVTETLLRWMRGLSESHGIAALISSHRLHEFVGAVDRAVVMADGAIVGSATGTHVTEAKLMELMRAGMATQAPATTRKNMPARADLRADERPSGAEGVENRDKTRLVDVKNVSVPPAVRAASLKVDMGEIVGIGGLEGQGQSELLRWTYAHLSRHSGPPSGTLGAPVLKGSRRKDRRGTARAAFVTGDNRREGVFPYWSVRWNTSIGARALLGRIGLVRSREERSVVDSLLRELAVRGRPEQNIMELSGGTQQKVVLGRALLARPSVLLLDDPTRGIDATTKEEIYRIFAELAGSGVGLVWYSSEISELKHCDRVYVMRGGYTVGELRGSEVDEQVLEMSFHHA
ncbi:MAG TPA: ATP-binding cassette domain-containing protein [Candidatus Polarisedimenticolia bacterium]|nr:ATP-binding cassette domain-containing protein [Candidatus Polarisedimenticolia bacterium]